MLNGLQRHNKKSVTLTMRMYKDETGYYYLWSLHSKSCVHKSASGVRGTKNMKSTDRAIFFIATNSTGTHKVPLAMTGNSKNHCCLGRDNRKAKIIYLDQKMVRHKNIQHKWFCKEFLKQLCSTITKNHF